MISRLLVLVLLSAADAITTPTGAVTSQTDQQALEAASIISNKSIATNSSPAAAASASVRPTAAAAAAAATAPSPSAPPPAPTLKSTLEHSANPTVNQKILTNQFVIQVQGGEQEARRLAQKHGFIYLNHIIGDYYHLEHRRLARRSLAAQDMNQLDTSIEEEPQVLKLERQVLKKRVKRDFIDLGNQPTVSGSLGEHAVNRAQQQQQPNGFSPRPIQMLQPNGAGRPAQYLRPANQPPGSLHYHQPPAGQAAPQNAATMPQLQVENRRLGSGHPLVAFPSLSNNAGSVRLKPAQQQYFDQLEMTPSGPPPFFLHANFSANQQQRPPPPPIQFSEQRHHGANHNSSTPAQFEQANQTARPAPFNDPSWPLMWYLDGGARNGFDLNVQAAWKMGYTGKGIVITILDDGLEKNHPDLEANYDPLASFDINGDDADPMPRYDANDSNRHGTRCAGEVAAVPDNNICSIGIAYNSKVGGVRMLDGDVTDAVEARSLSLNNQHIHIYSASWGPDDNGKTVDGPGELATRAFIEGVTRGRQGLGSIFVFASGNGGREHDNCNCDGYTNSIWTLSISSATENGFVPWYIEACSSTLATTYSSGAYDERQIATTDIRHSCTSNHTGTSASAPIAAGICALVLESNPLLTWRDMQHIVVRTAKPANLVAKDWRTNAMGRNVSHAFGYGLMDAAAMIITAKQWTTMPMQYTCQVSSPPMEMAIPAKAHIELKLSTNCVNVSYLEHVQSRLTLTASRRGDLHIYLTSPSGTRSTLLAQRPNDQAEQGFRNWPFMTVHNWGESPNGTWTLEVHNDGKPQNRAFFKEWTLTLYGTREDPNKHLDMNSIHATPATPQQHQQPAAARLPSLKPPAAGHRGGSSGSGASSAPPPPSFNPSNPDASRATTMATTSANTAMTHQQLQPKRPQTTSSSSSQHHQSTAQSFSPSSSPLPPPMSGNSGQVASVSAAAKKLASTTPSGDAVPSTTASSLGTFKSNDILAASGPEQARPIAPSKSDFDIVSAPAGTGRAQTQPGNHQPAVQGLDDSMSMFAGGPKSPASHANGDKNASLATGAPAMKPPVGAMDGNRQQSDKQADELDANQLDLKLTKDYRSSGGQDRLLLLHDRKRPASQVDNHNDLQDGVASVTFPDISRQRDNAAAASADLSLALVSLNLAALVYLLLTNAARNVWLQTMQVR